VFFMCEQIDDLGQDLSKFHGSRLRLRQRASVQAVLSPACTRP
jgi:hypothetical protein